MCEAVCEAAEERHGRRRSDHRGGTPYYAARRGEERREAGLRDGIQDAGLAGPGSAPDGQRVARSPDGTWDYRWQG